MYFSRVLMLQPYVASIYIPSLVDAQSSSENRFFFFFLEILLKRGKPEISHQVFRAFAHCLWGRLHGCDGMSHTHLDLGIFCCSSLQSLPSSVRLGEDHCQVSLEMFDWVHVRALAQQIKGIQSCPQDTPGLSWPCVFLGSSLLWTKVSLCLCTTLREILVLQKKKAGEERLLIVVRLEVCSLELSQSYHKHLGHFRSQNSPPSIPGCFKMSIWYVNFL